MEGYQNTSTILTPSGGIDVVALSAIYTKYGPYDFINLLWA